MRLLAIDPGGTVGITIWDSATPDDIHTEMLAFDDWAAVDWINHLLAKGQLDVVILEQFRITARTQKVGKAPAEETLEISGAVKYLAHCFGITVATQSPSDALSFVTDAKLKRLNWYTPGPDHARDSTRHLVLYLVLNRLINPATLVQ